MRLKTLPSALLCLCLSGCFADEVGGVYLVSEGAGEMPSSKDFGTEVFFQAGDTWRAWSSASWLSIDPKEGKSGRNGIVMRTVEANHTKTRRVATVTIESGGKQQLLTVWQRNDYALFEPREYVVDAEGGKVNMTFSSNVSKDSLLIRYLPVSWLEWEDDSAKTRVADWNGKVKVAKPNPRETERIAYFVLVLTGERRMDYQVLDTARVRQLGRP